MYMTACAYMYVVLDWTRLGRRLEDTERQRRDDRDTMQTRLSLTRDTKRNGAGRGEDSEMVEVEERRGRG
jgi:hypothetical protein